MMDSVVGTLVPGLVPCIGDLRPWLDCGLPHHYRWPGNHQPGPPLSPNLLCSSCSGTIGLHPVMLCLAGVPCCHSGSWLAFPCRVATLACCLTATAQLGRGQGPELMCSSPASSRGPNGASCSCTSSGLPTRSEDTQLCCIRAAPKLLGGWGEFAEEDYRGRWMEAG